MSEPCFSPTSQRDLREILEYIARDKPGAALRHIEKLEETCWFLAGNPEAGTLRDDLLPICAVGRTEATSSSIDLQATELILSV